MIFRRTRLTAVILVFVIMMLPVSAIAQGLPSQIVPKEYGCNEVGGCNSICAIAVLAQNVLNYGIFVAVLLSAFLFAYAGWTMLTSGGDSESYAKGKRILVQVLIGVGIILGGWILVDTLMKTFVSGGSFGPWNSICEAVLSHFERHFA